MNKEDMKYIEKNNNNSKLIKTEIMFAPLLIFLPFIVGVFFINDWYVRGVIEGNSGYIGSLFLGLIILIGNIMFDIPFIKSLIKQFKDN